MKRSLNIWINLKNYAENKGLNIFRHTPKPQYWYNFSIGSSEAHEALRINTRENEFSSSLDWIEANIATRIVQRFPNFDMDNDENIEKDFDWLID